MRRVRRERTVPDCDGSLADENATGASHLRIAIDGTVLSANQFHEVRKFEVIAGRVERDGQMARRFVSALAASEPGPGSCGGRARSMRLGPNDLDRRDLGWCSRNALTGDFHSLLAYRPRILDRFHISMKMQAIRSSICAYNYFSRRPEIMLRSQRLLVRARGRTLARSADTAIEMLRTLATFFGNRCGRTDFLLSARFWYSVSRNRPSAHIPRAQQKGSCRLSAPPEWKDAGRRRRQQSPS